MLNFKLMPCSPHLRRLVLLAVVHERIRATKHLQKLLLLVFTRYQQKKRKRGSRLSGNLCSGDVSESELRRVLDSGLDEDFLGFFMVTRDAFFDKLLPAFTVEYEARTVRRRGGKKPRDSARFRALGSRSFAADETLGLILMHFVVGPSTRIRQLITHVLCSCMTLTLPP